MGFVIVEYVWPRKRDDHLEKGSPLVAVDIWIGLWKSPPYTGNQPKDKSWQTEFSAHEITLKRSLGAQNPRPMFWVVYNQHLKIEEKSRELVPDTAVIAIRHEIIRLGTLFICTFWMISIKIKIISNREIRDVWYKTIKDGNITPWKDLKRFEQGWKKITKK